MADAKPDQLLRLLQIFSARLVLEVFGGGGAVWGFSESLTLRNPETQEFWRYTAGSVGAIFFIRWCLQIKDYLDECRGRVSKLKQSGLQRLLEIFSARMVLEVWGGAGAIWGFSEAMSLRRPDTQEIYRFYALTVGVIFLVRLCLQVVDFLNPPTVPKHSKWTRLLQIFGAKIVLEVFGGAGAIWGFSEVCTFRRPETQELWRFNALAIGFIFFIRYLMQIKDYFIEELDQDKQKYIRYLQIFSARMVLEVWGGAGAIWGFSEVCTYRRPETQEFWRFIALGLGIVFFIRFICQTHDYIYNTSPVNAGFGRLLQVFSAKLVLEVFGGGGAIWGWSEALSLRRPDTQEFYRRAALIVAAIFFGRFCSQIRDFICVPKEEDAKMSKPNLETQYSLPPMEKKHSDENFASETTPLVV
mmetsp:Transcript_63118/g.74628  ORF Transcript_63118/g.74628 Transcript_63118/m.74628 type:complete len:414 (-) Transcript_63118:135-1376(-)|eukprot:CAMPEP_0172504654 /NCGR_PEP_ID=MMETSP1066-20121228/180447_1 /TAXON_ID=671091 /ORGANISM="Coscinodiscus wailesii, Strain CCMP2513" /LENGTH=413 /DNA_ID=CAMNT_0013280929 /DNA_START=105 /DNA_END=1346 /DNA_ORIENTATION=+